MRYIFFFLFSVLVVSQNATAQQFRAYFSEDQSLITNPERGFSRWTRSEPNDLYPFEASWLNPLREDLKYTVITRTYYFTDAYESPISQDFLDHISRDLDAIRAAGMKLAIRFAYTYDYGNTDASGNPIPPFLDGPSDPELIFQHIEQLKPVLADNWDIILTMHNGFWGTWGENYYSDAFGSEANPPVTNVQWVLRKRLTDTLLNWIPEDRFLSQRYPQLKEQYYNLSIPSDSITRSTAYTSLPQARIGYHNDCFLVADNDYTYSDTTTQKPFVATESKYTIMGGETCGNSTFAGCDNALHELERFHWTYLNDDYHPDVLSRWEQEGCYNEIARRLGYRIVLDSLFWDPDTRPGEPYTLKLYMRNVGFAAPIHNRPVEIRLTDFGIPGELVLPVAVDIREWQPGPINITLSGLLPNDFPTNSGYSLSLSMPDPSPSLADDPRYAIALASMYESSSTPVFDARNGYNFLFYIAVVNTTDSPLKQVVTLPQNPIQNRLMISSTLAEELEISLVNISGKTQLVGSFTTEGNWDVSQLPAGMYVLRVRNQAGITASWKIVKVK